MKFFKMNGIGNDYIFLNCISKEPSNPNELAKFLCNRNFSVGGDGLVLILPSYSANFKMRIFNADGSEAEMCGNAIRCVGKYAYEKSFIKSPVITVETLAGIKRLQLLTASGKVEGVTVNMGMPILIPELIPVASESHKPIIDKEIEVGEDKYLYSAVSMGNPHAVIFVSDVKSFDVAKVGSLIENHSDFPSRTNVEFVEVVDSETIKVRVWERGTGETLGCGTGACASAVICEIKGLIRGECKVIMKGGDLSVRVGSDIYLTGTADYAFEGTVNLPKEYKFIKTVSEV